jgi:hypothetical protein
MSKAYEPYEFSSGRQRLAQKQRSAQVLQLKRATSTLSASLEQLSTPQGVAAQAHKVLTGFDPKAGVFTLEQLAYSDIAGTPLLAAVATSGDYNDLSNKPVPQGGPTGSRPGSPVLYMNYFDTTLNKPIWWNGTNWVNSSGATV